DYYCSSYAASYTFVF
nr:immunoglobulin light chain junction region [Macaca mulatta]MOV72195.1 immunoglobulin light chain junction region [Macaca mulatta]